MKSSSVQVGTFEAKTKLSELIERASRGSSFVITKHDQPVAYLTGYKADLEAQRTEATATLRNLRMRYRLDGLDARSLRGEGRA